MKTFTIGWLNKCRCGNKLHTVKTARGNKSALWDDDAVKCNSCGRGGVIQVCEGQARVLWETDEEMAEGKPMSTITKNQAKKIIEAADEVITALAGTNEDVHPDNSTKMVRLYDDLNDHYAPPEVVRELARIALASLEAEPVAYMIGGHYLMHAQDPKVDNYTSAVPLFTAHPAPIVKCPFPCGWENLNKYAIQDAAFVARGLVEGEMVTEAHRHAVFANNERLLKVIAAMLHGAEIVESRSSNSPVVPDGWVACSERMPDNDDFVYIWPRPDFGVELHVAQYGKFDRRDTGWYAQLYEQNFGIEYHPVTVTHWMPLPAAPQQEVTSARVHPVLSDETTL